MDRGDGAAEESIVDDDVELADLPQQEKPATKSEAEQILSSTRLDPQTHLPQSVEQTSPSKEPGFDFLHSLLKRSVFFDYFVHVAQARYAGRDPEPKVRKLVQDSRRFYRLMIVLDVALRGAVTVVLVGAGALVLLKTLLPLPWME